ncbi:hypothetical protein ANANG_G00146500 [Anguilla anguilla]|uniref:SCP domain-containing protein n=1 Tax=Anguilla anguilla TaxID=7936 RepID=A0A9D3MF56_ANGAN|nr:hypothetical protein ANANG_G00146500 [Anguilla anguilla]
MGQLLRRLLWYAAVVGSTVNPQRTEDNRLPEITDQDFISQCVSSHNRYRSAVAPAARDMFYMTWDDALAITARAWARHCKFMHNPRLQTPREVHPTFNSVGENIWVGAPYSTFTVEGAMKLWCDEVADYDYSSNGCTNVCGHYTQVVWAKSYKVGCAVQACPNGVEFTSFADRPGAIFVCNYGDAGNYVGVHPFMDGQSCSECGGGTCENNLCRDAKRDQLKRYDWTPSWDPGASTPGTSTPGTSSPASCGSYCLGVLITRPLSVLLIFIGVYGLQMLYPDIFFYE